MTQLDFGALFGNGVIILFGLLLLWIGLSVKRFGCYGQEALICGGIVITGSAPLRLIVSLQLLDISRAIFLNGLWYATMGMILFTIVYMKWTHDHAGSRKR